VVKPNFSNDSNEEDILRKMTSTITIFVSPLWILPKFKFKVKSADITDVSDEDNF
jgi:hypothetical protein